MLESDSLKNVLKNIRSLFFRAENTGRVNKIIPIVIIPKIIRHDIHHFLFPKRRNMVVIDPKNKIKRYILEPVKRPQKANNNERSEKAII